MNKYLLIILFIITFLFSACGKYETPQTPQQTSMNLTIKNGPALAEGTQYTMIISVGGKQYSSAIVGNSFNATIKDVPQGYQEVTVNIYEASSLVAKGYSQLYISQGYNSCIIDFKAPQITHNPALTVMYGTSQTITCSITDDVNQSNVTAILYYSNNGSTYQNISMTKSGATYSAIITNSYTRGDTVYYYIKASDPYRSGYFGVAGNVSSNVTAIQLAVVPNPAPMIYHTSVSSETQNIAITISTQIIDAGGLENATLFYKTSIGDYQSALMTNTTANTYTAQIPAASVRYPYAYYYIRAYDGVTYTYYGNAGYTLSEPSANPIPITVYQTPDITPPSITHTPKTTTSDSYLISITAAVTDDSYVNYIYIKYKKYNDANYQTAVMNNTSGDNFSGYISFITANTDTTYYYLEAYDGRNKSYYGLSGQTATNPELNSNYIRLIYSAAQQSSNYSISFSNWSVTGNAGTFTPDSYAYVVDNDVQSVSLEFSKEDYSTLTNLSFNFSYMTTFDTPLPVGTYTLNSGNIILDIEFMKVINTSQMYAWAAFAVNAGSGASGSVTVTTSTDTFIQGTLTATLIPYSAMPNNLATGNITMSGSFWMKIKGTALSQQHSAFSNVAAIASGGYHTISLKNDGTVWAWGGNDCGQLGDGTIVNNNTSVQVSNLTNIIAIAGGGGHTIALKNNGTVWAWGYNFSGQLGDGTNVNKNTPVQVSALTNITAIAGGSEHTIALKNDGTVWAWGDNYPGQLGDGTNVNKNAPVQVSGLTGIIAIAGGYYHTIALKNDGTVWAWGYNAYGQLGAGTAVNKNIPVQVSGLTNIIAIAGGDYHTIALKNDNTVWTCGRNNYGQLGDGSATNRYTPVQISGLTNIIAIASGGYHTIALKNDGAVWTWGYNIDGQLGDGTTVNKNTPVQVSGLTNIIAIAGGSYYTSTLKNDSTIWAWGDNSSGQLGDGTTINKNTPVQVVNP